VDASSLKLQFNEQFGESIWQVGHAQLTRATSAKRRMHGRLAKQQIQLNGSLAAEPYGPNSGYTVAT
jgi:hypothetical protein